MKKIINLPDLLFNKQEGKIEYYTWNVPNSLGVPQELITQIVLKATISWDSMEAFPDYEDPVCTIQGYKFRGSQMIEINLGTVVDMSFKVKIEKPGRYFQGKITNAIYEITYKDRQEPIGSFNVFSGNTRIQNIQFQNQKIRSIYYNNKQLL